MRALAVALMVVSVMAFGNAAPEFDDRPAESGKWGFRPADGREMQGNPPGFSWRPQKNAVSYLLQVARDEDCADVVYEALVVECEKIMADPPPTDEPPKYPEDIKRGSDAWRKIWWGEAVNRRNCHDFRRA